MERRKAVLIALTVAFLSISVVSVVYCQNAPLYPTETEDYWIGPYSFSSSSSDGSFFSASGVVAIPKVDPFTGQNISKSSSYARMIAQELLKMGFTTPEQCIDFWENLKAKQNGVSESNVASNIPLVPLAIGISSLSGVSSAGILYLKRKRK